MSADSVTASPEAPERGGGTILSALSVGTPSAGVQKPLSSGRLPGVDGWRAISIAMVLGAHSTAMAGFQSQWYTAFKWAFDGNLGVRFFFVISGFLITFLMVQEQHKNGSVSLRKFYLRRALRILPVYYAFILVVFGLSWCGRFHQSQTAWLGNLTFTTDFVHAPWTTEHLWSLSVEEQFYVIWPTLFVLLTRFSRGRNLACYVLAVPIVVAPVWRAAYYKLWFASLLGRFFGPFTFFGYFDSLAIGCLAAFLLAKYKYELSRLFSARFWLILGSAVTLIAIPHVLARWFRVCGFTVSLGPSFQATGGAILLLMGVLTPRRFWFLEWPWVQKIGILSYSIYIWQQIFCSPPAAYGLSNAWWLSFPWWLLVVLTVAACSYYGLEKPVMGLRARFRS
jgi:peptidoglycan/LPS O-acetylase OafA/YrhL